MSPGSEELTIAKMNATACSETTGDLFLLNEHIPVITAAFTHVPLPQGGLAPQRTSTQKRTVQTEGFFCMWAAEAHAKQKHREE